MTERQLRKIQELRLALFMLTREVTRRKDYVQSKSYEAAISINLPGYWDMDRHGYNYSIEIHGYAIMPGRHFVAGGDTLDECIEVARAEIIEWIKDESLIPDNPLPDIFISNEGQLDGRNEENYVSK